ncbi:MAG TPA: MFS transporter, partial [Baekduia sp.]|nr:MFS transporter [Baekduia sp.]
MKLYPRALGAGFGWIFAASTLTCLITGASTPLLARYAREQLGAPADVVGLIVGASSIAAIVLRPSLGALADRFGRRRVAMLGAAGMALGALALLAAQTVPAGTAARLLLGLTGAAANTALMAWILDLAPAGQRGRALGLFGLSIWLGLAIGPQIGQELVAAGGYTALWCGCGAMGLVAAACLARTAPAAPRATR